jgi:large subunit ribosomal protein L25
MEEIVLNVQPRTVVGKQVKALRRDGNVPAVLYSRRGEPVILQANNRELRACWRAPAAVAWSS